MSSSTADTYLICVRRKGHPKKHIDVCHQCRWRGGCKPYQKYRQPGLPLVHPREKKPTAPAVAEGSSKVKKKRVSPPPPVVTAITRADALDLLDEVKKELIKIRDLCN